MIMNYDPPPPAGTFRRVPAPCLAALVAGALLLAGCSRRSASAEASRAGRAPRVDTALAGLDLVRVPTSTGPLLVGVHEVTVGQFREFVLRTGYVTEAERDPGGGWGFDPRTGRARQNASRSWRSPGFEQTDEHPVVMVSWVDAEAFCAWLSALDGRRFRLPDQEEWEAACRGGTGTAYFYGDDPSRISEVANCADPSLRPHLPLVRWTEGGSDGFPFTAPVGSFRPNAFGVHDAHGNVWEWCSDPFDERTARIGPGEEGAFRVIRGGGWYDPPDRCHAEATVYFRPVFRYCQLSGFRVVCEPAAGSRDGTTQDRRAGGGR